MGARVMSARGPACYTRQVIKSYAEADDLGRDPRSGEQFPCDRSPHRMPPTPRPSRPASGRTRSTTSCRSGGPARVAEILSELEVHARRRGVKLPFTANTPYVNTIPSDEQTPVPGSNEIERRIKSLVRWNAMAMVVKANQRERGHRRPHLDLRLVGDALRGRLQPLLPRQGARGRAATSSTSRATPRRACTRAPSSKAGSRSSSSRTSAAS